MEKILIADDSELNREILKVFFENEYEIVFATNGREVVEYLDKNRDTIVLLLDIHMPEMNGFEVLENLKVKGITDSMPVIMITGESAVEVEERALENGVTDFIHKPFDGRVVTHRVKNAIELYGIRNRLAEKVWEQTAEIKEQNELLQIKNAQLEEKTRQLRETNEKIIDVLGTTVEFRHMDSYEHIKRVKAFTRALAQQVMKDHPEFGLDQAKVDLIVDASSLHDIGKISISDTILLKPGKLTKEEYEEMKTHTTKGGEILKRVKGIWDEDFGRCCYDICMYHHERYDGKGYPEGRVGEDIPLAAQIVSVVDVYDALVCKRVYKDAYPKDVAVNMILGGECGAFSPKMLESFMNCREEIERMAELIV